MRQFSLYIAAASVVAIMSSVASEAANYPTNAYVATYKKQKMTKQPDTYKNEGGVSDYRFVTDGQGRIRIETEPANAGFITGQASPKTVTIFDFPNSESYILYEKQKLAMRTPLKKDASLAPIDDNRIKDLGGKSLGVDERSGHKCHGWEYTLNGVKTETWTADDLKVPIDTFTLNADGSLDVLHLNTFIPFKSTLPSPEEFNVPRDYKMTGGG